MNIEDINSKIAQAKGYCPSPISKDKLNSCYSFNGEIYPLCKGIEGKKECLTCNVRE